MGRLLMVGAETNDLTLEGIISGSPSFVASPARSGSFAFQTGGNTYWSLASVLGNVYFARAYVYWDGTASSGGTHLLIFKDTGISGTVLGSLIFNANGSLALKYGGTGNGTTQVGSNSDILPINQWIAIELRVLVDTGSSDIVEGRLGNQSFALGEGLAISEAGVAVLGIGTGGIAGHVWHDDIAVNDNIGASQNSWPGDGKVILLVPISDNARATLWKGGVGGTTNLYDAVNNTPPIGTATETDLTQIEHAGGAAGTTDAYDANMTTYATAGLGASDTINVVLPLIAHGEDSATGTKLLTFSVVSNPAISAIANFSAGADAGALGTYPTLWTITRGNLSYAPSVTVGTSPVMRVTRPETASRVASVCFMGMYVDFTPRRAPPPFQKHTAYVWRKK